MCHPANTQALLRDASETDASNSCLAQFPSSKRAAGNRTPPPPPNSSQRFDPVDTILAVGGRYLNYLLISRDRRTGRNNQLINVQISRCYSLVVRPRMTIQVMENVAKEELHWKRREGCSPRILAPTCLWFIFSFRTGRKREKRERE